jgi:hypothetical protein
MMYIPYNHHVYVYPQVATPEAGKLLDDNILASLFPRGVFSDKLKSPSNQKESKEREKLQRLHKDRKISDQLQFFGNVCSNIYMQYTVYVPIT